ncbi:MAG TPA: MarR family transcriptional regulator [Clostridia bacterium]|nr:MarR family transcriptional regulator [Clostridia bacterium]
MNSIAVAIEQFARMIETIFEDKLIDSSLNRGQYAYLLYLFENEGANQYDISRDLFIDKTTVAKALKKLEETGYILRKTDQRDKRRVNVFLSKKGKGTYQEVKNASDEIQKTISTNVHPDLVNKLESLLEIFIQELDIKWCEIKNYKRDVSFSVASIQDMNLLKERQIYSFKPEEELFIERFGQYVINWIRYEQDESSEDVIGSELHFHQNSDVIHHGMELLREFEQWYFSNYSGKIQIRIPEGDISRQKLLHKNEYLFRSYDKQGDQAYYYYEKKK